MGRGKSQPLSSAIATDQLATEQPIYMLCSRLARSQGERLQQEGPPRAAWCGDAAGGLAAQNVGQAGSSSLSFLPRNCSLLSDRPGSLPSPHSPPRAAQLLEMPPSHPMGGGQGKLRRSRTSRFTVSRSPNSPGSKSQSRAGGLGTGEKQGTEPAGRLGQPPLLCHAGLGPGGHGVCSPGGQSALAWLPQRLCCGLKAPLSSSPPLASQPLPAQGPS